MIPIHQVLTRLRTVSFPRLAEICRLRRAEYTNFVAWDIFGSISSLDLSRRHRREDGDAAVLYLLLTVHTVASTNTAPSSLRDHSSVARPMLIRPAESLLLMDATAGKEDHGPAAFGVRMCEFFPRVDHRALFSLHAVGADELMGRWTGAAQVGP
ncbi:hypothetical protein F4778DRAFT_187591 [Xylariomycetidae sp. FL2044]|nr:hypothetical protein F4778DRAFT_187591 [Xylariomycetidae sp. FL2044]